MRKPLIAANWKMHKTISEATEFLDKIKAMEIPDDRDVLLCAPFTALDEMSKIIKDSKILLGAQNMHFEETGAFTGEISPLMLKETGGQYVILGHSERRHIFGEQDELINKKVKAAISHGIIPILCVGELMEEKDAGKTEEVLKRQLSIGLDGVADILKAVIAYEPVWAISRGDPNHKAATAEDAENAHLFIRKLIREKYGNAADETRIIYGGSMKPENVKELMQQQDIDGGLVGGASLDAGKFFKVIRFDS